MTQPKERKTAVGYIRVSTVGQLAGLSLSSQESEIREWCEQRGYDLARLFQDDQGSADTDDIRKRPQFAALLGQLPQLRPHIIVVHSLDCWARSTFAAADSFGVLGSLNIGFASVTQQPDDITSPLSLSILSSMASFEEYRRSYMAKRSSRKRHP